MMKRALLIAAGLISFGISGTLTTKVNANPATHDFDVNAGTPGTLTFSGSGTAQFNNSLGTNNSFQVGSSTNLGVNANVSSTNGYGVDALGDLQLAGSTQLQQVIGTSGTASEKVDTQAHDTASDHMRSWETTHGSSSSYDNTRYSNEREYQRAYDREYNTAYSSARSSTQSATSSNGSDGTISGSFRTIEAGTARSSGNSTDWASTAEVAAKADYGSSWSEVGTTGVDAGGRSKDQWQAAYDSSYNAAYANASASSNRYSDSIVDVAGIGSDANVFAKEGSSFMVDVGVITNGSSSSTDTASGSAGASLATSSFANQSSSSTASGFLQAFGAAAPTPGS